MWRSRWGKAAVLVLAALVVIGGVVVTYRRNTEARVSLLVTACPSGGFFPGELEAFGDWWSLFAGPGSPPASDSKSFSFDNAEAVRGTLRRSWGASSGRFVADDGRSATFYAKHHKLWGVGCSIS